MPGGKMCDCGLPCLRDSFKYRGRGVSGFVCIGKDCDKAWKLQDAVEVDLSA